MRRPPALPTIAVSQLRRGDRRGRRVRPGDLHVWRPSPRAARRDEALHRRPRREAPAVRGRLKEHRLTKIVAAIRSGDASRHRDGLRSANVGTYRSSGAFVDLAPAAPEAPRRRRSLPARGALRSTRASAARYLLADVADSPQQGAVRKRGSAPPRTISELTADAKKLTQRSRTDR